MNNSKNLIIQDGVVIHLMAPPVEKMTGCFLMEDGRPVWVDHIVLTERSEVRHTLWDKLPPSLRISVLAYFAPPVSMGD